MADEVEMIPVAGAEPPKVDPLAKPAATKVETIKLNPIARNPPAVGGASALKPGLKLPPKPGLAPGLKLPPKPRATVAALRPGLKLPTQTALKPGVKLPPKPVIRKPGAMVAPAPLPKPIASAAPTPFAAPKDATQKLKSVTQKLKSITQDIPQQAILRETGIISDGKEMSEGQKEAAKHKTARISLSEAIGVAPVKSESVPMKTIRIKRPTAIAPSAPAAPTADTSASAAKDVPADSAVLTQRKTLKISRPVGGVVRPAGKFGVRRPMAKAAAAPAVAAGSKPSPAEDVPDLPSAVPPVPHPAAKENSSWVWTLSSIVQFAACAAIGALAWFLYENTQLATFCGGLGWGQ